MLSFEHEMVTWSGEEVEETVAICIELRMAPHTPTPSVLRACVRVCVRACVCARTRARPCGSEHDVLAFVGRGRWSTNDPSSLLLLHVIRKERRQASRQDQKRGGRRWRGRPERSLDVAEGHVSAARAAA